MQVELVELPGCCLRATYLRGTRGKRRLPADLRAYGGGRGLRNTGRVRRRRGEPDARFLESLARHGEVVTDQGQGARPAIGGGGNRRGQAVPDLTGYPLDTLPETIHGCRRGFRHR